MALNALVHRHLAPPSNPLSCLFRIDYLVGLTPRLRAAYDDLCTRKSEQWKVGRGQVKLTQIGESITYDGLDYDRVNMMLKKEVNIVDLRKRELPKKARAIQFCTNLRTAYERAVEQTSFCHALAESTASEHEYGGIKCCVRYTAEMSPYEIAQFATDCEGRRAAYSCTYLDERDGKNWDANVQKGHRHVLADWYGEIDEVLRRQAKAAIKVRGKYVHGGVRIAYSVDGTVKSGHWDTSSGNGALNLEITMQAAASLPLQLRPVEIRGLIMGDDLLLWLYFNHEVDAIEYTQAINNAEKRLGINPVRGLFTDILNVSFCSMGFYWTAAGLACVPKLGRCFAKLFWTVTPLAGRDPLRMASTIAHAFYPLYHEYKPMRDFLKHHMRVPPIECDLGDAMPYILRDNVVPRWPGIRWAEGNLVKYGLPADALDDIGDHIRDVKAAVIDHPIVNMMLEQDLADPPERRGCLC